MEIIIGMLGAFVGVGIFVFGFWLGKEMNKPKKVDPSEPTEDELNRIQEERRRFLEDQEAFRNLMNYNADMAYGVTGNNLLGDRY